MIAQFTGALLRAFMVVLLVATPSLLLPDVSRDASQIVVLVSIFAAGLIFFEYNAKCPGLVEFRDAPPFNRIRFATMMMTVLFLTAIVLGETERSPMIEILRAIGALIGQALDFPYSPVTLVVLMLPETTDADHLALVRMAAGMAYLILLISLAVFIVLIRINRWPKRNGAFNVWVNLPTFDPTAGGDVVTRLVRDARFNIAMGVLLPFMFPVLVKTASNLFEPVTLSNPQTLIWMISAWAFLPASLFMRGIAIGRIAEMIREQRRRAAPSQPQEDTEFVAA